MITQKLVNLTNAMIEFEGWHGGGISAGQAGVPSVSYRNHNPGNLRWSIFQLGKKDNFAYFYNDATGMFAMRFDIMQKCRGRTSTGLSGDSTLAELIKVYSAAKDQELQNYVNFVCERIGYKPETLLKIFVK